MATKQPNVLVLFTDDQRFDTIAAVGDARVETPNLDRLVARGTAFTQAHIPSGMVGAVCMPSRAMLHTGRSLYHLDGAGETIPERFTMLGEAMQAQGYRTFGTGKWHNGPETYARSFTDGGEIMFGGMADHWNVPMCHFDPSGRYDHASPRTRDWFTSNALMTQIADHVHLGHHSTDILTDATLAFLDTAETDSPFFAYVAFLAPHDPRTMPEHFLEMYDPDEIDLPESYLPEHPFDFGITDMRDETLEHYPRSPEAIRRHLAEYFAMISHVDDAVGRVLAALEKRDLLDETIIVFAGDNGLAVGRHGLMGKQSAYEHSVRVPLVFAGPGVPAGHRSDAFCYLFDIFPTVCDLVGMPTPQSVEGQSLVASMRSPDASPRDELYFGYGTLVRAVKRRGRKLIYYAHGATNWVQLFDLDADPQETTNVAGLPAFAADFASLADGLGRLRDAWDDRATPWGTEFWNRWEANGGLEAAQIVR